MKTFEQFAPETQNAIKLFRENFWKIVEKDILYSIRCNRYVPSIKCLTLQYVNPFLLFNGCDFHEHHNVYDFLESKNFYLNLSKKCEKIMIEAQSLFEERNRNFNSMSMKDYMEYVKEFKLNLENLFKE